MSRGKPSKERGKSLTYKAVGVGVAGRDEHGLGDLGRWVTKTFDLHPARPCLPLGYFANVIPIDDRTGLAISTDGVGTKILIAQHMGIYDTVGIDCVAMNANDVQCVGARPMSLVDYNAVEKADPRLLGQLAKGLYAGAEAAGISIPAGEIAQIREMIHGTRHGYGFDLVGTCVGTVPLDRIIIGEHVRPGDVVVGLASSGIHSNGLTLARTVFTRAGIAYDERVAELGRTLGEELLTPTFIYVREIVEMLEQNLAIKALIHITGDGFLNLTRVRAPVGYVIDELLPEPAIFPLLQRHGGVPDAEMFRVYNMGVGFCVVLDPRDAGRAIEIAAKHGRKAATIGYAINDPERHVWVPQRGLVGKDDDFEPARTSAPARARA
jgi:phosphoribosylformylglycinamidine cyclo-ligase